MSGKAAQREQLFGAAVEQVSAASSAERLVAAGSAEQSTATSSVAKRSAARVPAHLTSAAIQQDSAAGQHSTFPEFLAWESASTVLWDQASAQAVLELCDELKRGQVPEPPAVTVAHVLSEQQRQQYPDWTQPFKAGQMFCEPRAWHHVFTEEDVQMSKKLIKWIDSGYGVYVDKDMQGKQPRPNCLKPEEMEFVQSECLDKWLESGAVSPIHWEERHSKAIVCNLIVAYRDGKMERACWSGVAVNDGVEDASFRMEQIRDILGMIEPDDDACSLDFEKGFHQVPLDQTKQLLMFQFKGKLYRWNVLPMGLKSAPKHFSAIVKQVLKICRKRGIRCSYFIDDVIILGRGKQLLAHRNFVLKLLYRLRMRVSLKKSLLNPGQLIKHLGFDICTANRTVWILTSKVQRIRAQVHAILSALRATTGRQLSALVGLIRSNAVACPWAACLTVGLTYALSSLPLCEEEQRGRKRARSGKVIGREWQLRDYAAIVQLSALAVAELRFWSKCAWMVRGTSFDRKVSNIVLTSASPSDFGDIVRRAEDRLCPAPVNMRVEELHQGKWTGRCDSSSAAFELFTVMSVVEQHAGKLAGTRIHMSTSNVGAAHVANRGSLRDPRLQFWAVRLATALHRANVLITTTFMASDGIIVAGADAVVQSTDVYACVLKHEAFKRIWAFFGDMHVDAWAAEGARQRNPRTGRDLPCISPFHCAARIGSDAMSSFDTTKVFYAFPPVPMIGKYLAQLVMHNQPAVLVVPEWISQPWWATLVSAGQRWLKLGSASQIFSVAGQAHPFGRNFDNDQAQDIEFWAVSLFH